MSKVTSHTASNITGIRISQVRKAKNLTQYQFAAQLADYMNRSKVFSLTTISAYETGRKQPSTAVLTAISGLYGVSVEYLLGMSDSYGALFENSQSAGEQPVAASVKRRTLSEKIPVAMYRDYHKKPVFVIFPNKTHADQWGLLDAVKSKVIFIDYTLSTEDVLMELYPLESYDYDSYNQVRRNRPLSAADFMSQKGQFWVEIRSADPEMRLLYNGYYIFGKNHKSIINLANGEPLPVSGFGKSFSVYKEPSDEYGA